tara:strand:- start:3362 stop:5269 length:1908 start_codon:yes stop_codon:yes gene_type:complete
MAGIIKTDKRQGNIIGVANCASFGKQKITSTTATGTVTIGSGTKLVDIAVVAGGGGGESGGGGAGGLRTIQNLSICGNVPAVVGAGGAAGAVGVDSSIAIGGVTYTADGGGDGGARCGVGASGGSGGGGGACGPNPGKGTNADSGGAGNTPATSPAQGFSGGNTPSTYFQAAGGGGGSSAVGANGTQSGSGGAGGAGGAGTNISPIFGTGVGVCGVIAGGGGGGANVPAVGGGTGGAAGPGGGGAGKGPGSGGAGVANTGGGGGGAEYDPAPSGGGAGGKGVVITKELNNNRGVWPMKQQFDAVKCGAWPDGSVIESVTLNYLVVGGGGAGKLFQGAGAGGYRASGYGPSPLQGCSVVICSSSDYTITIGAGGASATGTAYPIESSPPSLDGPGYGNPTSFSSYITSSGGAVPLNASCGSPWNANNGERGGPGGSGSGGYASLIGGKRPGGSGNIGGFSPPEGNSGGAGGNPDNKASGGGGGATAAGAPGSGSDPGVAGGAGAPNLITGVACSAYAGGGGSGTDRGVGGLAGGAGGAGGGGAAATRNACSVAASGVANTGGGGGGGTGGPTNFGAPTYLNPAGLSHYGAKGGSGIVVVRSPAGHPMSVSPGSNSISTVCGHTVAKFIVSGTLTVN